MMAAADRQPRPDHEYAKSEIKRLTEHDTRDRMKKDFDDKVKDSEWFRNITDELDKAMDCLCDKSYDELLLEVGGMDPSKIDLNNTTLVKEKVTEGLLKSEHLEEIKEEIFREWDKLRSENK